MYLVRERSDDHRPLAEKSASEGESREQRFLRLLDPIWSQLARYTRALAKEHEAARDLLAETVALAWEHFDRLRDEIAFKRYLFRIAVRLNGRARRRNARQVPLDDALSERLTTLDSNPERAVEVSLLYAAMELLPEKQREALMLFEISALTLEEIRAIQGGTLSGVKTRLARGRESLTKILGIAPEIKAVKPPKKRVTASSQKANSNASSFFSIPLKVKL